MLHPEKVGIGMGMRLHWAMRLNLETLIIPHAGAIAHMQAAFGQGTGPIHMDNVACSGTEQRLVDCRHTAGIHHNCFHAEDAGVTCLRSKKLLLL